MTALAGDDEQPGDPEASTRTWAPSSTRRTATRTTTCTSPTRVLSFTPEGSRGVGTGSGFIFQDVEADVQAEFERHVQFALDLARSADDPSRPVSHLGNKVPNFVVDDFKVSFGDPQTVQVNARRDLGKISLRYQMNGGRTQTKSTSEWQGGLRYGDEGDYWYHRMRGQVTGTDPGDTVKVWFTSSKAPQDERLVHLQGALGLERGRAGARGGGLQREQRRCRRTPTGRSRTTSATTRMRSRRTAPTYDVYDYDARGPQGAGCARRAEPLRRRDLVHGQRQRHARRAPRPAWRTWRRTARSSRCVTS